MEALLLVVVAVLVMGGGKSTPTPPPQQTVTPPPQPGQSTGQVAADIAGSAVDLFVAILNATNPKP